MLATEYAKHYKIDPQREGESDPDFQERVSGALLDAGRILEAHEVYQNERYETDDGVMTGVIGAVAQAMQKRNYGSKGVKQIGDDLAAGIVAQHPRRQDPVEILLLALLLKTDS